MSNLVIHIERIALMCPPWWAWDVDWREGKGSAVHTWLLVALWRAYFRSRKPGGRNSWKETAKPTPRSEHE